MSAAGGPAGQRGRHASPILDDALAFRLHRTNRMLRTHLARFLGSHYPGLSPEQWFVLARIAPAAATRQVDLAEPVLGDPPNVSRLVDALVERGLVVRTADPRDRRSFVLSLTATGEQATKQLLELAVDERKRVFDGFDESELDALASMLDRIDDNVRRLLAEAPEPSDGSGRAG